MRKFYSFVLMAAALLIGTNAWAGTYNVGSESDFQTAWAKSVSEDVVINLTSSGISLGKTMWLGTANLGDAAHTVEINMNGYPLTSTASGNAFILTQGTLKFSGNGQFTAENATNVFYVTGSTNKDVDPSAENANYFSHLEIGEGVIIAHGAYGTGIAVDGVWKGSTAQAASSAFIPASKPALTYITNVYANAKETLDKSEKNSSKCAAYGVRIDLKGTINARKYGIKVNGLVGSPNYYLTSDWKQPGNVVAFTSSMHPAGYTIEEADFAYTPYVRIWPTGRITVSTHDDRTNPDGKSNPIAIYASGYARWMVEGYASGCNGAVVKSGDVDFNDATVVGNGSSYSGAQQDAASGTSTSGSAIVLVSSAHYPGDIDVTIGGDSKVSATNGYAIDEYVVAANQETKVDAITINGGTFEGGQVLVDPTDPSAGTMDAVMKISEVTAEAAASVEEETTITIIGATTNSNESGAITIGTQDLADFLSDQGTTTHLTEVVTESGSVWVISEGNPPANETQGVSSWQDGASINWKNAGVITTPMSDEVAEDLKLAELQMNQSYSQQLTVKEGVTFEVGRVLLGSNAKIIVEAGGTFIVSGNQGITAPSIENNVLQHNSAAAGGGKYATFVFDPNVTSNRHPNATIEFTTKSWSENSAAHQWEWFGVPTYNAIKSIAATCPAFVAVYENNGWSNIGLVSDINANETLRAKMDKPFAAYDLLANRARSAAAPTITITGELVGNVNATLNAYQKWNPFANSYTAEVDAEAFVNDLSGNIADAIYLAKQNNNGTITWNLYTDDMLTGLTLRPMQAFLLLNNGAVEDATIDYETMVYDLAAPAQAPAQDPAPRRSIENTTKVTINVANENGTWDDVDLRENGKVKSLEKYLNDDVNIYVVAGEKNDYVAAEDLENTYVGFSTVNGGNFTISFAKAEGREFDLIDLETGARFAVSEGETYSFSAAANTANDYRFKLVAPAKMPTAIENTEVKANAKGIFTLTGQFLGEMNVWNTLPAGVYVVNGAKRVK